MMSITESLVGTGLGQLALDMRARLMLLRTAVSTPERVENVGPDADKEGCHRGNH